MLVGTRKYSSAQVNRLGQDVSYMVESNAAFYSGNAAPLWLSSNRHGLSSLSRNSGYLRTAVERNYAADSLRKWKAGYKADLVFANNHTADFIIHQLYGDLSYRNMLLTIGAKENRMEFNNEELSSGDMNMGINSRPIPQIRLDMPDFWMFRGKDGWFGIKGHIAYGWFTDNRWQRNFTKTQHLYSANSLYHSKALYVKIGNERLFPITYRGGIEIESQFGGQVWNMDKRPDDTTSVDISHYHMNNGLAGYLNAFILGGHDPNDGEFKNAEGNHVGSWHGSLTYQGQGWSIRGYFEHFFEDHSQLFLQYGWKDMNWGIETSLPKNPFVSTMLIELISTKDQTGGLYHDKTQNLHVQVSGKDNYYSHHVYGAWQHWGQNLGNPLLLSPIYYNNGTIMCRDTRIEATHIGINGDPTPDLHYRMLYTHVKSWGTYYTPNVDTKSAHFFLGELTYSPHQLHGWSTTLSTAFNRGDLPGNSFGASLSIRKTGIIK